MPLSRLEIHNLRPGIAVQQGDGIGSQPLCQQQGCVGRHDDPLHKHLVCGDIDLNKVPRHRNGRKVTDHSRQYRHSPLPFCDVSRGAATAFTASVSAGSVAHSRIVFNGMVNAPQGANRG